MTHLSTLPRESRFCTFKQEKFKILSNLTAMIHDSFPRKTGPPSLIIVCKSDSNQFPFSQNIDPRVYNLLNARWQDMMWCMPYQEFKIPCDNPKH